MGKILALDLGTKTLGVAITDKEQKFIFGRPTIRFQVGAEQSALHQLLTIIESEKPVLVIFGHPLHLDGRAGERVESVLRFSEKLQNACPELEITYIDERLTTFEAQARMRAEGLPLAKQEELVDQYAAKIILENYLLRIKENNYE
ncbi:MAG: Holliday junction resolvase RuvX [Bacilli bacterium]